MKAPGVEIGGPKTCGEPKLTARIIHRCQFRCRACSTFSGPEARGRMSLDAFERAMAILADADFRGILNVSGGEPTLHLDLPRMLARAARSLPRSRIAVFTHGHWVGGYRWRERLRGLLAGPNVLVRFSLDRHHAEGAALARDDGPSEAAVREMETVRLEKAQLFVEACLELDATPGVHFDVAFKGTRDEARAYTKRLGDVPLYLIEFRPRPETRPKTPGFFALDVDGAGRPLVFPTLGHIARGEALGGLETLAEALEMNRQALRAAADAPPAEGRLRAPGGRRP